MPTQVRVIGSQRSATAGLRDLAEGMAQWRVWRAMAIEDLRRRYNRAVIGLLWVVLSFFAFVFVKAVVFDRFSEGAGIPFVIYLATGFLVWQYMNSIVTEGADVFVSASNWMKGLPIPLSTFVFQSIVRNLVIAGYSSLVVVLALIYENHPLTTGALWAVPGVLMLIVTSVWVELLVGTVAARFRDIKHLMQTIMRITFFLTPVLWVPSVMGKLGEYTYWNPFANFIEIVRMPLMEGHVDPFHWVYVGAFSAVGMLVGLLVFSLARHRIVYWV